MNVRENLLKLSLILSILIGVMIPVFHERFFDPINVDVHLPENWRRMSTQEKLDCMGGLLSADTPFPLLAKIRQWNIKKQFKKMIVDKRDEVLRDGFQYRFSFRYHLGREELSLLGLAGLALVWMMYLSVRAIVFFIPSAPIVLYPLSPWKDRIETLQIGLSRQPDRLPGAPIPLPGLLSYEGGTKRPEKPRAVWID